MKNIILALLLSTPFLLFSQNEIGSPEAIAAYKAAQVKRVIVDGTDISTGQYKIIKVVESGGLFGIVYDEALKRSELRAQVVKDKDGKIQDFKQAFQLMNFLELNGWRHYLTEKDDYSIGGTSTTSYIAHYFRKET